VSQGSSLSTVTRKLGHQSNVVKVTRESNLQTPKPLINKNCSQTH